MNALSNLVSDPKATLRALDLIEARESFLTFCGMVEIPTAPIDDETEDEDEANLRYQPPSRPTAAHHIELCGVLQAIDEGRVKRAMFFLPPGAAKALALDTPIPTPRGWTTMGELKVGDQVFGDDGAPCTVTWVSPVWRDRPVYRVTTDCGDEIIADHDHEWRVRLSGAPRAPLKGNGKGRPPLPNRDDPASQFKIKETHELCRRRAKRPMIERAKPLELPPANLPVDPYLLGVWLGDGSGAGLRITASVEDQPWLREELGRLGYETRDTTVSTLFQVIGQRGAFNAMGLLNDPAHKTYGRKHIPETYLRASRDQRLALLQGLIDTDGTVCKRRGASTFCNTNRELAFQVRELVRSLGVKAGWTVSRAMLNGVDHGEVYRVSFYLAGSARLPRKAALTRDQYRTPDTYIDVAPAGVADTVCIEVDSPTHLFLCGRSMTPTHNSTYGSVLFPPWYMGRKKRRNVIIATYGSDLARKIGRRARAVVRQKVFAEIFGAELSPDSSAADEWALTNGNEFMGGGIRSGMTGNRADCIIIDDPIKGREEAESETVRKRTLEAYQDDLLTRLKPGGSVILIQTRWHEADLAGALLPEDYDGESGWVKCQDGEYWWVVNIPAQAERVDDPIGRPVGAYIWPQWFGRAGEENPGEAHFAPFKKVGRTWAALFQQRPRPKEGTFFESGWFKRYVPDQLPKHLSRYITSDHAPGGGVESDFSCVRVWGVDADGDLWLLDGFRHQATLDKTADLVIGNEKTLARVGPIQPGVPMVGLIRRHKPFAWFPEDDNNWKSAAGFIRKQMLDENVSCRIEPISPHGSNKEAKAQAFQAMAASGRVWLPVGPMGDDVLDQYLKFPLGKNDDEVDAAGVIGRVIDEAHPALIPTSVKPEVRIRYAKRPKRSGWAV